MPNDSEVLNARDAATFLGTHVETLRRLARRGDIPSFKVGKDWRFRKEALIHWADGQQSTIDNGPYCRALVIDDEERVCIAIAGALKRFGCQARQATSGSVALELIAEEVPDIIILDLKMPVMNGPEFLAELRKEHHTLPVIIMTGYPESELVKQAMEHAPISMLAKPVDKELLKRTVRSLRGDRAST